MQKNIVSAQNGTAISQVVGPTVERLSVVRRCRLCTCLLQSERSDDNLELGVCGECKDRPEARRLGPPVAPSSSGKAPARAFTVAEKSLMRKLHGFMPAQSLLALLNERLAADLGPDATPHTMEQFQEEIRGMPEAARADDWAGLRKLLAQARRDGVLEKINRQTIDDFAVVFSLNPVQVLRLKDVILSALSTEASHV